MRSNQSVIKEINPEYSLEGLMKLSSNTLATWCEEPTHWKRPWCWERLKEKGEGGSRGRGGQRATPTQWAWIGTNSRRQWRAEEPGVLQTMGSQGLTWLRDWATQPYKISISKTENLAHLQTINQKCYQKYYSFNYICILKEFLKTINQVIITGMYWCFKMGEISLFS